MERHYLIPRMTLKRKRAVGKFFNKRGFERDSLSYTLCGPTSNSC